MLKTIRILATGTLISAGGNANGIATLEDSLAALIKVSIYLSYDSTLPLFSNYLGGNENFYTKFLCSCSYS